MTPMYTPDRDVTIELPDKRLVQVAVKGVPMTLADAVRYGIVSPEDAKPLAGAAPMPRPLTQNDLGGTGAPAAGGATEATDTLPEGQPAEAGATGATGLAATGQPATRATRTTTRGGSRGGAR